MTNLILAILIIVFTYGDGAGWGSWSMWIVYAAAAFVAIHSLMHKHKMAK